MSIYINWCIIIINLEVLDFYLSQLVVQYVS